jgi:hypothetical protein
LRGFGVNIRSLKKIRQNAAAKGGKKRRRRRAAFNRLSLWREGREREVSFY